MTEAACQACAIQRAYGVRNTAKEEKLILPNTEKNNRSCACSPELSVANDNSELSVANDNSLPSLPDDELYRVLKAIGWYDKEIRGPHHDEALRRFFDGQTSAGARGTKS